MVLAGPPRPRSGGEVAAGRLRGGGEVDKALLWLDAGQLYAEAVADLEARSVPIQLALDEWPLQTDPRPFRRRASHHGAEDFADAVLKDHCRRRFSYLTLHALGSIL